MTYDPEVSKSMFYIDYLNISERKSVVMSIFFHSYIILFIIYFRNIKKPSHLLLLDTYLTTLYYLMVLFYIPF